MVLLLSGLIGLCAVAGRAVADDTLADAALADAADAADALASDADIDEGDGDVVGSGGAPLRDAHAVEPRSSIDVEAVLAEESLAAASGLLDTTSMQDVAPRHRRSRWGRLDLAVALRLGERVTDTGTQAVIDRNTVTSEPRRRGALWLLLTWRN